MTELASILVVDDERVVALDLAHSLRGRGYTVRVAPTGEEALARAEESRPDLVLLDVRLRAELDGIETAGILRERFNVPVIFLTAFTDASTVERAKATSPYGYLLKPYEETELHATIDMALEHHRVAARVRASQQWLTAILAGIADAVIATDSVGRVTYMNPRAEGLTGWSSHAAAGLRLSEVFDVTRDDRGDWRLKQRGGGIVPVEQSSSPLVEDDGHALGTVLVFRDISERKAAEDRLKHDALHDALTGLPNRALFMDRLERACERGRRKPDYLFAVLFVDIDRFKVINDSLGHAAGDGILVGMAQRLGEALRTTDTVARFGGDEFVILLDDLEDSTAVRAVVERLHEILCVPFHVGSHELVLTASIGVVFSTRSHHAVQAPEELLRDADTAMYRAKAAGRARYEIFDAGMHAEAVSLQELERDLHRAVARKELRLVYQPIVDLGTGELAGFEALCRWRHPERGEISPGEFIPVAEENGQIAAIGDWVLGEALRQRRLWLSRLPPNFKIAVNLSSRQFGRPDMVESIAAQLAEQGANGSGFALEITENAILDNATSVADTIRDLRKLGLQIRIDDFGTGYSSLSYLHRFPVDMLKIDSTFVRALGEGRIESQIVWTIVNLARSLHLQVVAEGVETKEQLDYLRQLECHYAQGFYFARPLEASDATTLLRSGPRLTC